MALYRCVVQVNLCGGYICVRGEGGLLVRQGIDERGMVGRGGRHIVRGVEVDWTGAGLGRLVGRLEAMRKGKLIMIKAIRLS